MRERLHLLEEALDKLQTMMRQARVTLDDLADRLAERRRSDRL